MNWYPRFPGDYMRDTAHLSVVEHGAYTLLLDHYYSTNGPLPESYGTLIRICRAYDDVEQDAVKAIADQYFPIGPDGKRHNKRADEQLLEMNEKRKVLSEAGKRGMKKRWKKQANNEANNEANNQANNEANNQAIAYPHPHPHPHTRSQKEEYCSDTSQCPEPDDAAKQQEFISDFEDIVEWIPCSKPKIGSKYASVCRVARDQTTGAKYEFPIPRLWCSEWKETYPDVYIERTLKEIRQKIRDTGKYIKTPQGVRRMVGNWMNNEQNKGGR
jgi:uncharacterized protein YdaU (DUF1376 family)